MLQNNNYFYNYTLIAAINKEDFQHWFNIAYIIRVSMHVFLSLRSLADLLYLVTFKLQIE